MSELAVENAIDFSGGQDVSKGVRSVPENKYYSGINVSAKNGNLRPRWGYNRLAVSYEEGTEQSADMQAVSYQSIFEGGKFQAAVPFYSQNTPYIITVISGFIFLINVNTNYVSRISIANSGRINGRLSRVNRTLTDKYAIFYDWPDVPVIVSGNAARRSNVANYEIPTSRLGVYNQSRLFIANEYNEFTGGDPVGNLVAVEPPITFEEVFNPAGAAYYQQVFQLPTDDQEPISAMATLQAVDTSTGIGPLLVATTKSIHAYGTHVPRSQWEAGQFGSSIVSQAGVVGPRAFVNANSDAFFISSDGHVRSLSMSQQEQGRWSRLPISREIDNWIKVHDKDLLKFSSAAYFNNKLFFTVNPFRVAATDFYTREAISDYAFGGMAVLELDNITSFGEPTVPSWAGLWTGIRPMEFVTIADRLFVFSKDYKSVNRVYEIDPNLSYDCADDKIRQIRSKVYTRSYAFGNPFNRKKLHSLELNVNDIKGDFQVDVTYKVAHSPYFYAWRIIRHYAPWRLTDIIEEGVFGNVEGHAIRDLIIGGTDADSCNPITDELIDVFKEVQLSLEIIGACWEITGFRVKAVQDVTTYNETIKAYKNYVLSSCDNTDWNYEEFGGCQQLQT